MLPERKQAERARQLGLVAIAMIFAGTIAFNLGERFSEEFR